MLKNGGSRNNGTTKLYFSELQIYLIKTKRAPVNNALADQALELVGQGTLIWFYSILE